MLSIQDVLEEPLDTDAGRRSRRPKRQDLVLPEGQDKALVERDRVREQEIPSGGHIAGIEILRREDR